MYKYILIAVTSILMGYFSYPILNAHDEGHSPIDDPHSNQTTQNVDEHNEDEGIVLSADELKEFKVKTAEVGNGIIHLKKKLYGEIVINPNKRAHLKPRYGGVVKEIRVNIGDYVKKGETVAVIEGNESLELYELKSSIDGVVLEVHMSPGEIKGNDEHAIMIANLSEVWARLDVYREDLAKVNINQKIKITDDVTGEVYNGVISFINPVVDEEKRTSDIRINIKNSGKWKPGMFVTSEISYKKQQVPVVVRKSAIQLIDDVKYVFVKEGEAYHATPVKTGISDDINVQILEGLSVGSLYVNKGSFVFKTELIKESISGGHNH